MSVTPEVDLEGLSSVASSTLVRILVPSTDAPGQPFCRLRNRLEDRAVKTQMSCAALPARSTEFG